MTRKGKGYKSKKSQDEEGCFDNDAEATEEAGATAASPVAANAIVPATNEDVLAAINALKSAVDVRFDELKGSLSTLKSALSDVTERVSSTEAAVESHEKRLAVLPTLQ